MMNSEDMNSIFEQINNLKKPVSKSEKKTVDTSNNTLLNGKVVPKIETLQKIASATHTRLVISFENFEGDD